MDTTKNFDGYAKDYTAGRPNSSDGIAKMGNSSVAYIGTRIHH